MSKRNQLVLGLAAICGLEFGLWQGSFSAGGFILVLILTLAILLDRENS